MPFTAHVNSPDQYALGLGLNEANSPVCLTISTDSLLSGQDPLLSGEYYILDGGHLRISSIKGSVVLSTIPQMCLDAAQLGLPLVVIDPVNEKEALVEKLAIGQLDIYRDAAK